jgi:hypothetical protein
MPSNMGYSTDFPCIFIIVKGISMFEERKEKKGEKDLKF